MFLQHTPVVRTHEKILTWFTLEIKSATSLSLQLKFPHITYRLKGLSKSYRKSLQNIAIYIGKLKSWWLMVPTST